MPYFDHNATTPLLPAAREAWLKANDEAWANPSSPYRIAARAHRLLDEARERVAAHLGAQADEILFTSGATEANNAVIYWASHALDPAGPVLVSNTEHPSVLEPAEAAFGDRRRSIVVDGEGGIDVEQIRDALRERGGGFVAMMAANNETGRLGPIDEVDSLCRESGALFLCDTSQWIGRMPAAGLAPGAFLVGCAHKFGGPKGVGLLRVPRGVVGFQGALGGEQEKGRRAGTENYPAIAGMVAALEFAASQFPSVSVRATWRTQFLRRLIESVPGLIANAAPDSCLWNTISLRMAAHENTRWVVRLDKLGFEVSTGSACATGSSAPSHVLAAMGLTPDEARRTIRISSGWETTERDWMLLADAVANVWEQLQAEEAEGGVITL